MNKNKRFVKKKKEYKKVTMDELVELRPKGNINRFNNRRKPTSLTITKDILRQMWRLLSYESDFNLGLNVGKTIIDYLDRIDGRNWMPESTISNVTLNYDMEIKMLSGLIYSWASGSIMDKSEAISIIRELGTNVLDKIDGEFSDDSSMSARMRNVGLKMQSGMGNWSYTPLDDLINNGLTDQQFKKRFVQNRFNVMDIIKDELNDLKSIMILDDMYHRLNTFNKTLRDGGKPTDAIERLQREVEKMAIDFSGIDENSAIDMIIDFSKDNIDEVLKDAEAKMRNSKPYSTGLRGVDLMTQGGFRPGEYVNFGALSHNYKSGMVTTCTTGVCIANDWSTNDDEDDETLVLVSLEDNLENFYRNSLEVLVASNFLTHMPEIETMLNVESSMSLKDKLLAIPFQVVVRGVTKTLESRGLKIITIKADPTSWSMQGLLGTLESLMLDGVNIKIVVTDYLDKLSDANMGDNGVTGEAKRMKIRKARNWGLRRGILWMNPWQLNSDISRYLSGGTDIDEFMRYMATTSKYMGNSTLNSDMDLELFTKTFVDKEVKEGTKFLGVSRGKHRGFGDVDDKLKVVYYEFKDGLKPGLDAIGGRKANHKYSVREFANANASSNDSSVDEIF